MLLDAAKKLLAEYTDAWAQEPGADCVFEGDHAFTKAEDLFHHVVEYRIDYGPAILGKFSREELLVEIETSQLEYEKTSLRYFLIFSLVWTLFSDEQKSKFTRLFTSGDRSEDATWSTIVAMHDNTIEIELSAFSVMLDKHLNDVMAPRNSSLKMLLDDHSQDELFDYYQSCDNRLDETKTRFKFLYATLNTLLTTSQQMSLRSAIL